METINYQTFKKNLNSTFSEILIKQKKVRVILEDTQEVILISKKEFDFIQNIINPGLKV